MSRKYSQTNFDLSKIKETIDALKEHQDEIQENYQTANNSFKEQPLGKKILVFFILILVGILLVFLIFESLDSLFVPKNSITVDVIYKNGQPVTDFEMQIRSDDAWYEVYNSGYTILNAIPGEYTVDFIKEPAGYNCDDFRNDTFVLYEGGKVNLEYTCE